jgi:seryl-tRNA synthetase
MGQGKRDEAEAAKQKVKDMEQELLATEKKEEELQARIKEIMMVIPNIIDPSVPIGKDDSENVEIQRLSYFSWSIHYNQSVKRPGYICSMWFAFNCKDF